MRQIFLILFLILSVFAFSQELELFKTSIFYSGKVEFELKDQYDAGEILKAKIKVSNLEAFPIFDSYLVIEIVKDCPEPVYPTYYGDCNVIYEGKVEIGTLINEKTIEWEYKLPKDLENGDYRLDVYFLTKRTPIAGIPASFTVVAYKPFKVRGEGNFPLAKIVWSKTHIAGGYGQSGPGVLPNSIVEGAIFIKAKEHFEGKLNLRVCEFDDTACDSFLIEKSYPVKLKGEKPILISFKAPKEPNAYAVRLELIDENGRLHSLYRGRIVVLGESMRILKLVVNKPYFEKGEEGWIRILATGPLMYSPTLFPKTKVENVEVKAYILSDNTKVFEDRKILGELGYNRLEVIEFKFEAPFDFNEFKVCAKLNSKEHEDEYCYSAYYQIKEREIPKGIVLLIILLIIISLILICGKWKKKF